MRKLIFKMHVSLDGYIANANKDMSWMVKDDDAQWQELFALLKDVDLFVLGRGMWAEYRDYWRMVLTQKEANKNELAYAQLAERTPHLVVSNTLTDAGWENASVLNGDAAEQVAALKQGPGRAIQIVGGGQLAASLMSAGLVDEYHFYLDPVLLGGGNSLMQQVQGHHDLQFVRAKTLDSGLVLLTYARK